MCVCEWTSGDSEPKNTFQTHNGQTLEEKNISSATSFEALRSSLRTKDRGDRIEAHNATIKENRTDTIDDDDDDD